MNGYGIRCRRGGVEGERDEDGGMDVNGLRLVQWLLGE